MKKHILGLAIFSFIVGTAALVYGLFAALLPTPRVAPVETPSVTTYPSTKSCWKMKQESKIDSVQVYQAVFNLQSKEFSWELTTTKSNAPIALHFFSKDGAGTRYITTETVNGSLAHNGFLKFNTNYPWMGKDNSFENLYVVPEFVPSGANYSNAVQPRFDAANATAVTLDYGKKSCRLSRE